MAINFWNIFSYPTACHKSRIHARKLWLCDCGHAYGTQPHRKANIFMEFLFRFKWANVLTIFREQIIESFATAAIMFTKISKCNFKSKTKAIRNDDLYYKSPESDRNTFSMNCELCSFSFPSSRAFAIFRSTPMLYPYRSHLSLSILFIKIPIAMKLSVSVEFEGKRKQFSFHGVFMSNRIKYRINCESEREFNSSSWSMFIYFQSKAYCCWARYINCRIDCLFHLFWDFIWRLLAFPYSCEVFYFSVTLIMTSHILSFSVNEWKPHAHACTTKRLNNEQVK